MSFDAGTIFARLGLDTDDFDKALGQLGKKASLIGAGMVAAGAGLTAAITLPVVAIGKAALQAGAEAAETENLFRVSFGNMAAQAEDWARRTSDALGLNEFELKKQSGTIFNMVSSMGLARDEAFAMATGMTKLAADMASFRNIGIEEAFTKLRSGITGEAEPLKQLGILVTENFVKQTEFAKSIEATGRELTEAEKVTARWQAILAQTANDQGDLARTMDSPINQIRRFQETMAETAAKLGQALLPILGKFLSLLQPLANLLQAAVDKFAAMPMPLQAVAIGLVAVAAAIGPVIIGVGTLTLGFGALSASVGALGFASVTAALVAFKGAVLSAAAATATFASSVALPVVVAGLLGVAIGSVIFKFLEWIGVIETLKDRVNRLVQAMPPSQAQINAMAQASAIAGREVKTWGEATGILAVHIKGLQQETLALTGATTSSTKSIQEQVRELMASKKAKDDLSRAAAALGVEVDKLDPALAKEALRQLDAADAAKKHAAELKQLAEGQRAALEAGIAQWAELEQRQKLLGKMTVVPTGAGKGTFFSNIPGQLAGEKQSAKIAAEMDVHLKNAAARWREIQGEAERAKSSQAKAIEIVALKLPDAKDHLDAFNRSLQQGSAFAQIFGDGFGKIFGQVSTGISGFATIFKSGGITDIFKTGAKEAGGGFMGALSGVMAVAGPIGAIASTVIGLLSKFLKPGWKKVAEEGAELFGKEFSEQLAKKLEKEMKSLGSLQNAISKNIGDVAEDVGVNASNIQEMVRQFNFALGTIENGTFKLSEQAGQLEKAFGLISKQLETMGVAGAVQIGQLVARMRELGAITGEVQDFVKGKAESAVSNLSGFFDFLLEKEHLSGEEAQHAVTQMAGAFAAAIQAGGGLVGAFQLLGPGFGELSTKLQEILGGENAVLNEMTSFYNFVSENNEQLQALDSLSAGFQDLLSIGIINKDNIADFSASFIDQFNDILSSTDNQTAAFAAMGPQIGMLMQAFQAMGVEVPPALAEIAAEAEAAGANLVPPEDAVDILGQIRDLLKDLVTGLNGVAGAARGAGAALAGLGDMSGPDFGGGIPFREAQHGFSGLVGGPMGPVGFIAGEAGVERVTIEPLGGKSQGVGDGHDSVANVTLGPVTINLPPGSDRDQADRIALYFEQNIAEVLTRVKKKL